MEHSCPPSELSCYVRQNPSRAWITRPESQPAERPHPQVQGPVCLPSIAGDYGVLKVRGERWRVGVRSAN